MSNGEVVVTVLIGVGLFALVYGRMLFILWRQVEILEREKQERIDILTDPDVIDAELERSARRREAFDSNMPYPPREDSGPPAVVRNIARAPSYRSSGLRFKRRGPFGQNRPEKDS
jgi:hypothetical protein